MKENVKKMEFKSLDKRFGGAVIYYPTFGRSKVSKDCDHKWLYYNYERYCRVCERIEPFKDKLKKAVNKEDKQ